MNCGTLNSGVPEPASAGPSTSFAPYSSETKVGFRAAAWCSRLPCPRATMPKKAA